MPTITATQSDWNLPGFWTTQNVAEGDTLDLPTVSRMISANCLCGQKRKGKTNV